MVNIFLVRPLFRFEETLDSQTCSLGQEVKGLCVIVVLPCLDIEDSRNLFLSIAILLGASYRDAEAGD